MNSNSPSGTSRKLKWLKIAGFAVGGLTLLAIIGWFIVSSGGFLKSFVLPRVGSALNAKVTAERASWSPFSSITLNQLVVQPNGAEPLLQASELRVRYHLWSILGGNMAVDEVTVEAPRLTIVQHADGTSNLDPLLQSTKSTPPKPEQPSGSSKPLQLNVKSVSIKNGVVRMAKQARGSADQVTELSGLNFTLADLKNAGTAKLDFGAALAIAKPGLSNAPASTLNATLKSALQVALDANLQPQTARGESELSVTQAAGDFREGAAVTAKVMTEISPTEVKQLSLVFTKANQPIGTIQASGPFDLGKGEGKLAVTVGSIDRQVLNLVGALEGMDFGNTTLNSTNNLEVKNAGKFISIVGGSQTRSLSVSQNGLTTPTLDVTSEYQITVDQLAQSMVVQTLTLDGRQRGQPLLHGSLSKPMKIEWGNTAGAMDESALKFSVTNLNFADWRAFLGTNVRNGVLTADVDLLSQQGGKRLAFSAHARAGGLAADFGETRVDQGGLALYLSATLNNFEKLNLTQCTATVSRASQEVVTLRANGTVDLKTMNVDAQTTLDASLAALTGLAANPGLQFTAGQLQFSGSVRQQNQARSAKGSLKLSPTSGALGDVKLDRFEAVLDCDVGLNDQSATINQFAGKLLSAGQPGGTFNVSGKYDQIKQAGELTARLTDLNQNILRPFLAATLGNKQLVSGAINANVTMRYDAKAASACKGDLQATNFVINDPSGQIPRTPLGVTAAFDASLLKQVFDLRQCRLALAPTARATNVVDLTGKVDLTHSNAITGTLKLAASTLDVTSYYDLFTGGTNQLATRPTVSPKPETEPAAVQLPFKNFTADAVIGRLWLREVEVANLQATVKLDGGHILAKPVQCTLNGKSVSASADVDLGVPGYRYDVNFNAPGVLLAPLVNSFVPERKNQLSGTLTATAQFKGAGITGASLQRNLTGQFNLASTNLNLAIPSLQSSLTKGVINSIISIPEGVKNPRAFAGNLVGQIFGGAKPTGGWTDEFTKSPINTVILRGMAGDGKVQMEQVFAESAAFQVSTRGDVTLAPVLTNSLLNFPISVSLRKGLADQVGLTPSDTPTNAVYARIPDFLTVRGALGKPDIKRDYFVLAQVALKATGGVLGSAGNAIAERAGGVLDALGNLVSGQSSTNNSTTTNRSGFPNPFNFLNPQRDTNRPTNTNRPLEPKAGKR